MKIELSYENKLLIGCLVASIALIAGGVASGQPGVIGNTIILSIFIIAIPQFFFRYQTYSDLKDMEGKFPVFLRDLIESIRSGVPFHQAVVMNSKLDYGRLSAEVKKMANQISWGMPFDKVIDGFAERTKRSKRLNMSLKIIKESYFSGGDTVSTLESVADAINILDETEKEKSSILNEYVVLMYAIAFLFVGIVAAINKLMIPIFETSGNVQSDVLGLSNPCASCYGLTCKICDGYGFISGFLYYPNKIDPANITVYYTALFFVMSVIVSISCGLVAGQISENSIFAGLKHSLIMTSGVVGAFYILIQLKVLGI